MRCVAILAVLSTTRGVAATLIAAECPDKVLAGYSVYDGGLVVAQRNLTSQADCCALCHGEMKDECLAWEFIDQRVVHSPDHNCDIMAKVGPLTKIPGRASALASAAPPTPGPSPPAHAAPCHADSDCEALWATASWRCLEDSGAMPSALNTCHMHAETTNTTCACLPDPDQCGKALRENDGVSNTTASATRYLIIGDSISEGMTPALRGLLRAENWSVAHNPGNGDNTNYGAHCISSWVESGAYDVISFQFGLHDIAYDEERLTVAQYAELLADITQYLVKEQQRHGTKLLWVKTTPVPTVDAYGFQCNGTATVCLNPARFDRDVVRFNAAADAVMAAEVAKGATIATADLYSFVTAKCGGVGYASCPGFQLPKNVHFTPAGWDALAAEMHRTLVAL